MRVLVLTAEARVPDLSALYQSLPRYLDIDLHVLGKAQQRQLRRYLAGLDLQSYQRILLDLPFKHMVAQATLLARLPGLLIYEEDACQNYLATSKWQGAFSRFYRQLPAARLVVTGASVAQRLRSEGFDALFMAKGYNPHLLFNEQQVRDIELGFIGRTASRDYAGRKALLDSLAALLVAAEMAGLSEMAGELLTVDDPINYAQCASDPYSCDNSEFRQLMIDGWLWGQEPPAMSEALRRFTIFKSAIGEGAAREL